MIENSTENRDPYTAEGIPNVSIQNLMREMRFVDIIVDCVFFPFSSGLFEID